MTAGAFYIFSLSRIGKKRTQMNFLDFQAVNMSSWYLPSARHSATLLYKHLNSTKSDVVHLHLLCKYTKNNFNEKIWQTWPGPSPRLDCQPDESK